MTFEASFADRCDDAGVAWSQVSIGAQHVDEIHIGRIVKYEGSGSLASWC